MGNSGVSLRNMKNMIKDLTSIDLLCFIHQHCIFHLSQRLGDEIFKSIDSKLVELFNYLQNIFFSEYQKYLHFLEKEHMGKIRRL